MPSPSWKRSNAFSVIGEPASLPAWATTSATGVLLSITNSWLSSAFSLRNLAIAPSTIFSTMLAGLPLSLAFSMAIARSRSISAGVEAVGVERQRVGGGDVHRDLLAERLERLGRGRALQRDQHADLAEARSDRIVDIADTTAPSPTSSSAARRSDWFSPIVAMLSVSFSSTVPPPG